MRALGRQVFADLYGCDPAALNDVAAIEGHMLAAARACGATVVAHCFHHFAPHGVSGVVVIAESHLALHTWPEHGFAALDLFTCGASLDADACVAWLARALRSDRQEVTSVPRGRALERGAGAKS